MAGKKRGTVDPFELARFLDRELRLADFPDDSSVNGLQFEGRSPVSNVALAVDASQVVLRDAIRKKADLLLVHHGLVWNGIRSITGTVKERIGLLYKGDLSLYACHLPLDAHPVLGNNAQILRALGARHLVPFGRYHGRTIGFRGSLPRAVPLEELARRLQRITGSVIQPVPLGSHARHLAVVSGGGAGSVPEMERTDIDTYITGEPSHTAFLQARELGKNLIFAGHYATETFGVRAVGARLQKRFGLNVTFLDHPTNF